MLSRAAHHRNMNMQVNVYNWPGEEIVDRDVTMEDLVNDIDRAEARYNLEKNGRYWASGVKKTYSGPRSSYVLLMRV